MAYLDCETGRRVYFEDHGGSGRPFLLIHGWAMSGRVWDTTLSALGGQGHRVVTFDHRGCGLSDKDFTDVSIAALASDAVALAQRLDLRGVVVNGWSLGGAVATAAAHQLGDRCAGLVLTCGASPRYTQAPGFPHGGTGDDIRATIAAAAPDRASFFRGLTKAVCAKPVGEVVEQWMWSLFMQAAPSADASLLDLAAVDQREMLAALKIPVLSIIGGEDGFVSPAIGEAAAAMARDGRLERFEGCGHAPFIEDYAGYVAALIRFAAHLDAAT